MHQFLFIDFYQKAFTESDSSIYYWEPLTLLMYFFVFLLIIIMGWLIESHKKEEYVPLEKIFLLFCLAFTVLVFISGLRGPEVGTDTPTYRDSFANALITDAFSDETTEPGYQFALKVCRFLFPSADLFVFIVSSVTVFFILYTFWTYGDYIDLMAAFTFYVGMYYFQGMSLMRIYMTSAFLLWNFHYLIEQKYLHYSVGVLAASLFHYSSLVLFMPLGFLLLFKKYPLYSVLAFVIASVLTVPLASHFSDYIAIARYADYGDSNEVSNGIGFMLFFDYLPCFFFIYYAYREGLQGQWRDLLVAYTLVGFFVRLIAYYITIAGRLGIHFSPLYLLVIPYFLNHLKFNYQRYYPVLACFLLLYAFLRLHLYFSEYLAKDGLMPYSFIWSN
jgi:hypothetical protein